MSPISTQFSYPAGVRPLLPAETVRRRRIESLILGELESADYQEVIVPIVDFIDPYSDVIDRALLRQSYRFADRDGDLLMIRADFTPLVARLVAPILDSLPKPLRLCYRGEVVQLDPTGRAFAQREHFQIGAELVGIDSVDADVEILRLAARSVTRSGARPSLAVTDIRLAASLIQVASPSPSVQEAIWSVLRAKRTAEWLRLRPGVEAQAFELLTLLLEGRLDLSELIGFEPAREVALRLQRVVELSTAEGDARFILALDDIPLLPAYYTGIRFQIFSDQPRVVIGRGGRYDSLYGAFGSPAPAIGFTLNIDAMEQRS